MAYELTVQCPCTRMGSVADISWLAKKRFLVLHFCFTLWSLTPAKSSKCFGLYMLLGMTSALLLPQYIKASQPAGGYSESTRTACFALSRCNRNCCCLLIKALLVACSWHNLHSTSHKNSGLLSESWANAGNDPEVSIIRRRQTA